MHCRGRLFLLLTRQIPGVTMKDDQINELLLQALTHEEGGVLIYQTALKCLCNEDLREEWQIKTAIGAARAEQASLRSR